MRGPEFAGSRSREASELRRFVQGGAGRMPRSGGIRPRIVVPRAPERGRAVLFFRAAAGSLGLVLFLGSAIGLAHAGRLPPALDFAVEGPGRLDAGAARVLVGEPGAPGPAGVRDRFLATGGFEAVEAERDPFGRLRVAAVEKRAVGLLDADPPLALAADGSVLGPATAAEFDWSDASDLVVIADAFPVDRGEGDGDGPGAADRLELAGALAAALRGRPRLDRTVSEIRVGRGPLAVEVVLQPWPVTVLLTRDRFLEGLEIVDGALPGLLGRWPELERIDARVADRLFVIVEEPAASGSRADSRGGSVE